MQTFYPVFESGQVLTNGHLNQMSTWLNEQQQTSRRKLFGIGIVCGLEAYREANNILVKGGVAVSSAGFLLSQEANRTYTQCRDYKLPVSAAIDDAEVDGITVPTLLPDASIPLWELLTEEYSPITGEPNATALNNAFLGDKVVLLLLEAQQQSLKNCDVKSCADKGERMQYTLRTLLISEADAITLWRHETANSDELLPADLNWQILHDHLQPVGMNKFIAAASGAASLEEIHSRVQPHVKGGWKNLESQLQASFDVYAYLLRERFPTEQFPTDPWVNLGATFEDKLSSVQDLILQMHHYDGLQDAIASYNEFLEVASEYQAVCCPDEHRFPYHVLLGKPTAALEVENDNAVFAAVNFNIGAENRVGSTLESSAGYLRHPFYPCPQLQGQKALQAKMLDLYYRTWLIFKRYRIDNLLDAELKISPSKRLGELSQKAIPYYFSLNRRDDLHRNWSPDFTRKGKLTKVAGYGVSGTNPHPLTQVPDDHDFYRVEGIKGKPLGQLISELRLQKLQLGLSFAIEPVFLPVQAFDKGLSRTSLMALLMRDNTMLRLFKCKTSDMDMVFLLLLSVIFQLLLTLIYLLARLRPSRNTVASRPYFFLKRMAMDESEIERMLDFDGGFTENNARIQLLTTQLNKTNEIGQFYYKQVKDGCLSVDVLLDALNEDDDPNGLNAEIFKQSKLQEMGDLFERVKSVVGNSATNEQLQENYQTARMMQQSEKLMELVSVESIAQFDFDDFDRQLNELNSAHLELNNHVVVQQDPQLQAVLVGVNSQMNMLSTLSQSSLLSNMREEFSTRIKNIFDEFMFDRFAKKHPGLEHLCGVPKGGTLVLAYTHKSLLEEYTPPIVKNPKKNVDLLKEAKFKNFVIRDLANGDFVKRIEKVLSSAYQPVSYKSERLTELVMAGRSDRSSITEFSCRHTNVGVSATESTEDSGDMNARTSAIHYAVSNDFVKDEDPLNNMIVVADFCLPTFCCDSDCSDLELAVPDTIISVSVRGTVVEQKFQQFGIQPIPSQIIPIVTAKLEVLDDKNKSVKVNMTKGSFIFNAIAGDYRVIASAPGYSKRSTTLTVFEPSMPDVVIELEAIDDSEEFVSVRGTVVSMRQRPITTASLNVFDDKNTPIIVNMTKGLFTFNARAGDYHITASAPGYVKGNTTLTVFERSIPNVVIELDKSIIIDPIPVSGTVVEKKARQIGIQSIPSQIIPIAKANLNVLDDKNKPIIVNMTKGSFTFNAIAGDYRVIASAPGYSKRSTTLTVFEPSMPDVVIELEAIDDSEEFVSVRGTVVSMKQRPITAASLHVFDDKNTPIIVNMTTNGSFTFNARAGDYHVTASARGYFTRNTTLTVFELSIPDVVIELQGTDEIPIDSPIDPETKDEVPDDPEEFVSVRGTVVEQKPQQIGKQSRPIATAKLEVLDDKNKSVKVKMTNGSFIFNAIVGDYRFIASAPGYVTHEITLTVLEQSMPEVVIELQTKGEIPVDFPIDPVDPVDPVDFPKDPGGSPKGAEPRKTTNKVSVK